VATATPATSAPPRQDWWTDRPMLTDAEVRSTARGMDPGAYCRSAGFADAQLENLDDIWGWSCVDNRGNRTPVNLDAVCQQQYGEEYQARYHDAQNAYSWGCLAAVGNGAAAAPAATEPAADATAPPRELRDWITTWTLTQQEGDDLLCFGPCPRLCRAGCDDLQFPVFQVRATTAADRANGIDEKWCAEVTLIAKDDEGVWADKRVYYEFARSGGQLVMLDGVVWVPDLELTPACQ